MGGKRRTFAQKVAAQKIKVAIAEASMGRAEKRYQREVDKLDLMLAEAREAVNGDEAA